MSEGKTVTVTVKEGCVLYHEGHSYGPGEEVEVSAADAKTLKGQGVVVAD